jgi:hypothetical protein
MPISPPAPLSSSERRPSGTSRYGRSHFDFPDGNNLFCLCVLARSGIAFKMRQNNRQNGRRASLRVRAANAKSEGSGDFNNERPAWGGKEAG